MLFLLRPRQTWMPYALPRDTTAQAAYDRDLNRSSLAQPRQYAPAPPAEPRRVVDTGSLRDLGELHRSGQLTDEEFAAAKRRVLDPE